MLGHLFLEQSYFILWIHSKDDHQLYKLCFSTGVRRQIPFIMSAHLWETLAEEVELPVLWKLPDPQVLPL